MNAPSTSALHGSCACERNQYTILVPATSVSEVQVFFDNSAANRRSQATPLTAWLRVPLAWYHSETFALFPDETHNSIRRTFHSLSGRHAAAGENGSGSAVPPTRRQFCGYCGTHLSAWSEQNGSRGGSGGEWMDVTLGSLMEESLKVLESLGILADSEDEVDEEEEAAAEEDDGAPPIDTREVTMANTIPATTTTSALGRRSSHQAPHPMRNRGMPFFESMVENSRLGRIKRQKGGHTSRDGRVTVSWEVVEIDGGHDGGDGREGEVGGRSKRPRLET